MELHEQIENIAKVLRCNFTLRDAPISTSEVFALNGLLPSIMRRADQLCSFCLGYGLGLTFESVSGSMTGSRVIFDDASPNSLRLLCATDVLVELMQSAPTRDSTPLDELIYS